MQTNIKKKMCYYKHFCLIMDLLLTTTLGERCHYSPHFTQEETEAQRI